MKEIQKGPRIRVAFCIDNMNVGGTELNAVRTAERLDRSRFDVQVVCLQDRGPLLERYAEAGIPVHPLPIANLYGWRTLRQGMRLARLLREEKVDILHAHDAYSNVFAVPWARVAGVKAITSRRWWKGTPGLHWKVASRLAYHGAHVALANSRAVGDLLMSDQGLPRERVAVIPNFVDEHAFLPPSPSEERALRAALGITGAGPVVGIVANLHPVKDQASLVRAFALCHGRWPDARLVLVGDGERRSPLQDLARDLGIAEHVRFAGRRPNRPNLHHLFDVSVLCSLSEGLPNSILEAMAAGRPVVATRVGACADAVLDEVTGLLVPPAEPERLAGAIDRLLSDPVLARTLGGAGRERAREAYSAESALSALEALYERLADPGMRGGGLRSGSRPSLSLSQN